MTTVDEDGAAGEERGCVQSKVLDHVAVPAADIDQSVQWYTREFGATVLYQDKTWAFLQVGGSKLALVTPTQHPPHIAFSVTEEQLAQASQTSGIPIDKHRDGTKGIYVKDPAGNAIELICYPPGETIYTPYSQISATRISIVAESRGDQAATVAAIKRAIHRADPTIAAGNVTTLDALVVSSD